MLRAGQPPSATCAPEFGRRGGVGSSSAGGMAIALPFPTRRYATLGIAASTKARSRRAFASTRSRS